MNHTKKNRLWITPASLLGALCSALTVALPGEATAQASGPSDVRLDPSANITDVYAFVTERDGEKFLTAALSAYPFQEPAAEPNLYRFDPDVVYVIHVSTGADLAAGRSTYRYSFSFEAEFRDPETIAPFLPQGVVEAGDEGQNFRQTFRVTLDENGDRTTLGEDLLVPPNNQGRLTPFYNEDDDGESGARGGVEDEEAIDRYTTATIHEIDRNHRVFAGQRDDGFFGDIQSIFDMDFSFAGPNKPFDSRAGFNVHTIVLEIPLEEIGGEDQVAGVYASSLRRPAPEDDGLSGGTAPGGQRGLLDQRELAGEADLQRESGAPDDEEAAPSRQRALRGETELPQQRDLPAPERELPQQARSSQEPKIESQAALPPPEGATGLPRGAATPAEQPEPGEEEEATLFGAPGRIDELSDEAEGLPDGEDDFVQVGRQGNPLFKELFVAAAEQNNYGQLEPGRDDELFRQYAESPELAEFLDLPEEMRTGRTDLAGIFIPDVITVDLSTPPARLAGGGSNAAPDEDGFSRLSHFGNDVLPSTVEDNPLRNEEGMVPGGWPNGRRFGDDVIDIAVLAIFESDPMPEADLDGVPANDAGFHKVFPYAATPHNARSHKHHAVDGAGREDEDLEGRGQDEDGIEAILERLNGGEEPGTQNEEEREEIPEIDRTDDPRGGESGSGRGINRLESGIDRLESGLRAPEER